MRRRPTTGFGGTCVVVALTAVGTSASAQQIQLTGPLTGASAQPSFPRLGPEEEPDWLPTGLLVTVLGTSGLMVADGRAMEPAPTTTPPAAFATLTPQLDGEGPFLGTGLRLNYQGRYFRIGGGAGAMLVDRGLTLAQTGPRLRNDASWAARMEVFAGGRFDLYPVLPYVDGALWLDIVQTRFDTFTAGERGEVLAYNAYAFGAGPRAGFEVAIAKNVFLDLSATVGVVGVSRAVFAAGFGWATDPIVR